MRNHRTVLAIGAMTLLIISYGGVFAQRTSPTRDFMRQKLSYSQGILEGLTLEKYDLVVTNATALRSMSVTNAYFSLGNRDYFRFVTNFQRSVDGLLQAAKEKDLDAATVAYSGLARNCVQCHEQFRREQHLQHSSSP